MKVKTIYNLTDELLTTYWNSEILTIEPQGSETFTQDLADHIYKKFGPDPLNPTKPIKVSYDAPKKEEPPKHFEHEKLPIDFDERNEQFLKGKKPKKINA